VTVAFVARVCCSKNAMYSFFEIVIDFCFILGFVPFTSSELNQINKECKLFLCQMARTLVEKLAVSVSFFCASTFVA